MVRVTGDRNSLIMSRLLNQYINDKDRISKLIEIIPFDGYSTNISISSTNEPLLLGLKAKEIVEDVKLNLNDTNDLASCIQHKINNNQSICVQIDVTAHDDKYLYYIQLIDNDNEDILTDEVDYANLEELEFKIQELVIWGNVE